MQIEPNQTHPNITYRCEEEPGFFDLRHVVRLQVYTWKHSDSTPGVIDRYMAWTGPRNKSIRKSAEQALLEDVEKRIVSGRYYFWSYAP